MPTKKKTLKPEDLYRLKFIHGAQLSPDGKRLVYSVSHTDPVKEEEFVTLWLLTLASGQARQLTSGLAQDMFPQWSPHGDAIAFLSTRSLKPQIFLISVDGGEARQLTDLEQGVSEGPVWSPDGMHIAFAAKHMGTMRNPHLPYRVDRPTYRFDGVGYIDEALQDIFAVQLDTGDVQQITDENCVCSAPRWSPDSKHILYSVSLLPDTQRNIWPGLRVINVNSGRTTTIVGPEGRATAAVWLPDGQRIAYTGLPDYGTIAFASNDELWIAVFDGEQGITAAESRTAGMDYGIGCRLQPDMPVWHLLTPRIKITPDSQFAYVNVQIGGTLHVYRVALNGPEHWQPIVQGDRAVILLDANIDQNTLLCAVSTLNTPPELFTVDLVTGKERRQTVINDAFLEEFTQPQIETLQIVTPENVQLQAWFIRPPSGEPPYPTVLYIHGGPYGSFGEIFNFDCQILAGAGFAVLLPNFRGSAGYGADFSKAIIGNWGEIAYADNMAAVDYVIERGLADPDKLGICGYSHGGFATCWTIGHTDRFKAAVPENAVTNWITSYGVSDASVSWITEEFGGHPHEMPDVYLNRSPIIYAHNCTTPTLLVVGESDFRCPAEESEQFYAVLKASGCVVEMLRLPNSSHIGAITGPTAVRFAQNEALIDWFNCFLTS